MKEQWFETATPESQGIPSSAILSFIEECERERIGIDALIIMRNGKVVTEGYWAPFEKGDPHRLFSAGKAIVSTAILFAIDEGLLKLDDTVAVLLKDSLPENYSDKYDRMTLYDLLTMHTGHVKDTFAPLLRNGGDREKTFLSIPPDKEPGTHFLYNNGVPDILGIILYKLTGQRVYEYLENRLFKPLGMDSMYVEAYRHLDELPTMTASTRSLFKLAKFYADHGVWNGKQLLNPKLVDMAGSYLVPSLQDPEPLLMAYDTQFGYGFQIWRNSVGGFRIDGGRGQFGIVIPDLNLVAAINATEQDQGVLPVLFWKHVTNRMFAKPIAEQPETYARLNTKLASLTWAEKGNTDPSEEIWGAYQLEEPLLGIQSVTVENRDGHVYLTTDVTEGTAIELGACNDGTWHPVRMPFAQTDGTYHGSSVRKNFVAGGDSSVVCSCVVCREPSVLEMHFRGKSFMGGKIFKLDIKDKTFTFLPYDDFARANRSSAVKHVNLDKMMASGAVTVSIK